MTVGELAGLFRDERGLDLDLEVVPCEGWRRRMRFAETGLPWVLPSPNMPTPEAALVYPGMCLIEGTNLSEGRGTTRPFQLLGAPWLDGAQLAADLTAERLPGVRFRPAGFTPTWDKHAGRLCHGVELHVHDPEAFRPFRTGLACVAVARAQDPDRFAWRTETYEFVEGIPAFDLLCGSSRERLAIEAGDRWRDLARGFAARSAPLHAVERVPPLRGLRQDGPMRETAILGGSFNPPHVAHVMAAYWALATQGVSEVWMLPSFRHPFGKALAPFEDRVRMCELAAAPIRGLHVCTAEADLADDPLVGRPPGRSSTWWRSTPTGGSRWWSEPTSWPTRPGGTGSTGSGSWRGSSWWGGPARPPSQTDRRSPTCPPPR